MLGLKDYWISALVSATAIASAGCSIDSSSSAYGVSASATDDNAGSTGDTTGGLDMSSTTGSETSGGSTDSATGATGSDPNLCGGDEAAKVPLGDGSVRCCYGRAMWPKDPPVHEVNVDVLVNGEPFVSDLYDDGDLFLVDRESGDRVPLGSVQAGSLRATAFAGTYDVVYEAPPFPVDLPRNASAVVYPALEVPSAPIIVDIPAVEISGIVEIDGSAPSLNAYDAGRIYLVDAATGSRTLLGTTSAMPGGAFGAKMIPGTYDVHYGAAEVQDEAPVNSDARILEGLVVQVDGLLSSPLLAIKTVLLDGDLSFGDAPLPPLAYDRGYLYLRDATTGALTRIHDTALAGGLKARVIDNGARYDVFYQVGATQGEAPANEWARLNVPGIMGSGAALSAVELKAGLAGLKVPVIEIAGSVTVDAVAKGKDPNNRGEILVGGDEDRARVGDVEAGISARVIAASYDVFFRHDVSDGGLPINTQGLLAGYTVAGEDLDLNVDIATVALSGTFTIDGEAPPTNLYEDGRLYLRNGRGDSVLLGRTSDQSYARRVVEGVYDVYYGVESSQGVVPVNHDVLVAGGVKVSADAPSLPIDITTVSFAQATPVIGEGLGDYYLREIHTGDEIKVGTTLAAGLAAKIIPGDYALIYRAETPGDGTPDNLGRDLGCFKIDGMEW